ncbi:MAG: hypothetical protein ACXQS3_00085, partial [Candidatus Methanofastidiosia archaeon]
RSERGPGSYACIASLLETWSYQGKDPYEELDTLLREELASRIRHSDGGRAPATTIKEKEKFY